MLEPKCALHPSHVSTSPPAGAVVSQSPWCSTPIFSRSRLDMPTETVWGWHPDYEHVDFSGWQKLKKHSTSNKGFSAPFKWLSKSAHSGVIVFSSLKKGYIRIMVALSSYFWWSMENNCIVLTYWLKFWHQILVSAMLFPGKHCTSTAALTNANSHFTAGLASACKTPTFCI